MAKIIAEMVVEKVTPEAQDVKNLLLRWPEGYDVEVKTGQFVTLFWPDTPSYKRAYSLSSCALDRGFFEVTVKREGKKLDLQPREFRLLEYLMKHAGQVVTRTMLLENVWDYHFDPQTNVIDVHISRLRQKLDKEFDKPLLKTVRGAGYMLDEPEQDFPG